MRYLFGCALCAMACSTAAAIDVTTDTVFGPDAVLPGPTEWIEVRGDSTLTLQGADDGGFAPVVVSRIRLHDTAKLVMHGGTIHAKPVYVTGNNRIDMFAGRFRQQMLGDGNLVFNADGDAKIGGTFEFSGGTQEIILKGLRPNGHALEIKNSPGALVRAWSSFPEYTGSITGDFALRNIGSFVDATPVHVDAGIDWLMFALDDRPDGDTNADFTVDLADFNNVRNHFGSLGSQFGPDWLGDTFPMDGKVDLNDLNTVRNQFGMTSQPLSPSSVPEPPALVLLSLALMAMWLSRSRCREFREKYRPSPPADR